MATTREQALVALLAAVEAQNFFTTLGRRARDPSAIGPALSPACFLVCSSEEFENVAPNLPSIGTIHVTAFVYNDVGAEPNAIPETGINNAVDALKAALAPDNKRTGYCTLGGLVNAAYLKGTAHRAAAELTGKAMALVPIEILLP